MKERRFTGFKIATLLTLGIAISIYIYLFGKEFSNKKIVDKDWTLLIIFFIFFSSTLFQIFNIKIFSFLVKHTVPKISFKIVHTILLALNVAYVTGMAILLYGIISDFLNKSVDIKPSLYLLLLYGIWMITNLITIISSLSLRKYLYQQHETNEQYLLENLGKNEI